MNRIIALALGIALLGHGAADAQGCGPHACSVGVLYPSDWIDLGKRPGSARIVSGRKVVRILKVRRGGGNSPTIILRAGEGGAADLPVSKVTTIRIRQPHRPQD